MSDLGDYQQLRQKHPGWCTIESEPAIFNQILRDAGAPNVRVIELYSLDESILDEFDPIIGLIFLCRWKHDTDEETEANCPNSVWFANQVSENSCGSLAMINILFNTESVTLGEELNRLKSFTQCLTPPLRGLCLQNYDFLRKIHNSFARRSEILQNNLDMINACKDTKTSVIEPSPALEPAYHFLAYVPSGDSVWELDGLKRQPVRLGANDGTRRWLLAAMPRLQLRISKYSDGELRFTLLALTQSVANSARRPAPGAEISGDMPLWAPANDILFPYATRVRHPYSAFMRRYIQVLAGKGVQVGHQ